MVTTERSIIARDELVRFTRLPNGVLQVRLTEAARAGLASSQHGEVRDAVSAAVRAKAAEISSRRRWLTISRRRIA